MFDSILNYIVILIPIAIFIGRAVTAARNRRNPPPPQPEPHIPIHFEDDYEEDYLIKGLNDNDQEAPQTLNRQTISKPRPKVSLEQTMAASESIPSHSLDSGLGGGLQAVMAAADREAARAERASMQAGKLNAPPPSPRTAHPFAPAASAGTIGNLNISHHSVLRQAVIMSEILGQPKGLQD